MHGDELGVTRHFAGEEYDGNEDEQRTEHIHIVGQERYIIIVDDLAQRDLVFEEIVHFLRQVKHDGDRKNEHDREKERAQELLYYIPVEAFHANLQFTIYNLHSCGDSRHDAVFPCLEVSGDDMLACLCHQIQIEGEVMDRQDLQS